MTCSIVEALDDRSLLGAALGDMATWAAWRTVLKAAFGLPLSRPEAKAFGDLAGHRKPPKARVSELWCIAGRRGGKSRVAGAIATYAAAFEDHKGKLAPGEVGYVLVLSPSKAQARAVRDYVEGFMRASPILAAMILDVTTEEIRLTNGVVVAVHTNSFRTVRGKTLLACIFDESAYWRDEASASPDVEVYRAVLPALATTGGMLVGISSPYRRVGLLHQKHRDYFGKEGDVLVIQAPTRALNPTIDRKVIDRARASDPEAARAEWDAEFRSDLSALLDDAVIDAAIDYDRPLELPPRRSEHTYFAFTDASAGRHDAFTFAIGHIEGDRVVIDVLRGRKPPFDPNEVAAEYAALAREYGCHQITGDNFAGEWTVAAFMAAGVSYLRCETPKSGLYLESVAIFMRGAVSIPDHTQLIRELRLLERRVAPSGKDRVDHGSNGSDDFANALVGVMSLAIKPPRVARMIKVSFGG
jgi:hypothetical protein